MKMYNVTISNNWMRSHEVANIKITSPSGASKTFYKKNITVGMLPTDVEFAHKIGALSSGISELSSHDLHRFNNLCDTQGEAVPTTIVSIPFKYAIRMTAPSRQNSVYTSGKQHQEIYTITNRQARRFETLLADHNATSISDGMSTMAIDSNGVIYRVSHTKFGIHMALSRMIKYTMSGVDVYAIEPIGDDSKSAGLVVSGQYDSREWIESYNAVMAHISEITN